MYINEDHVKTKYSSPVTLVIYFILLFLLVVSEFVSIRSLISYEYFDPSKAWIIYLCYGIIDVILLIFMYGFCLNRACCKITYDSQLNTLTRRGLFCGFHYTLNVNEIKEVVLINRRPSRNSLVIIDNHQSRLNILFINSFLQMDFSKASLDFVRLFWDKPINGMHSEYK